MTESYKMTGKQMRDMRRALRMSQERLGALIGASRRKVCELESGKRNIDAGIARALAYIALHGTDYPCGPYGFNR